MSKITLRAEVKLDEADYNKILDFAEKHDKNPELKDIGKLMENVLVFNFSNIMQQIAAAEAAEKAAGKPPAEAKVALYGANGAPLGSDGNT